ncbi:MAG: alpha-glucuronidase family glycosyl hydrolase [Chitinophagaceae bacterium]
MHAESGYELWLRYKPVENKTLQTAYRSALQQVVLHGSSATFDAIQKELENGLQGLLQSTPSFVNDVTVNGTLLVAPATSAQVQKLNLAKDLNTIGNEGFIISSKNIDGKKGIVITGNSDKGLLYGLFHLLRLMQTNQSIQSLHIVSAPKLKLRLLNHWDNLDRTVERGYAGFSLWNWHTLPTYIDPRYIDYARANASVGINGTVLTNVNANATVLTPVYLDKVAALANTFRPYGIKVYLTARFSAPVEIGGLKTADPLDKGVQQWWKEKVAEIYQRIPDFGGFLVKANSEGQPGPQNYGRSHAEGANMLADAIAPFGGVVMWRAFVYSSEVPDDRHKQAYNEFKPLDGTFRPNVMVQVKNGAIDFQPREPFHPLFGAMPKTPLMMEFQVTQEYLGQATNLVYLAPLFKETLDSDTYSNGSGSTVAKVIDGNVNGHMLTGMAGVSNIGNDINWTGHPFAQANWYSYGRLAWDHQLNAEKLAKEWLRMTFTNDAQFLADAKKMMMRSWEITTRFSTPIGLHHLMGTNHHYGPAPWVADLSRADWNPVYYHKADSAGIGFNRTASGSNALGQYAPQIQAVWKDPKTIPQKYLLWFHHLPWTYKLASGRNVWEELCYQYNAGVDSVRWMQQTWDGLKGKTDVSRFTQVQMLLQVQYNEAVWWRDACLQYFQTFSQMPIPPQYPKPKKTLEYYKSLQFPFAPGI